MSRLACLVLAAGASARMGKPKALLPWGSSTIIEHLLKQLEKAGLEQVALVTGAHHEEIQNHLLKASARICQHTGWSRGMGSSIATGLEYVQKEFPEADSVLLLLSDQPFLKSDHIKSMLTEQTAHPGAIIATAYDSGPGVPALFPRKFWNGLKTLHPASGAKGLIRARQDDCRVLSIGSACRDIDTPEDYKSALESYLSNKNTSL